MAYQSIRVLFVFLCKHFPIIAFDLSIQCERLSVVCRIILAQAN